MKNTINKIRDYWQLGLQTAPNGCFHFLRRHIRTTAGPGKPSKHAEHGFVQVCLRWLIYAELLLQLMPPPAKRRKTARLALLRVPRVKRWRLLMFPNMPSAVLTMLLKPLQQLTLTMPRLTLQKNAIGKQGVFQKI